MPRYLDGRGSYPTQTIEGYRMNDSQGSKAASQQGSTEIVKVAGLYALTGTNLVGSPRTLHSVEGAIAFAVSHADLHGCRVDVLQVNEYGSAHAVALAVRQPGQS